MKIVWSPLALKRTQEIADYIAQDKPVAAREWVEKLFKKAHKLAKLPKSGRVVPEINQAFIREIIWQNYRIIYKIDSKQIAILTVRHQKQILPLADVKE